MDDSSSDRDIIQWRVWKRSLESQQRVTALCANVRVSLVVHATSTQTNTKYIRFQTYLRVARPLLCTRAENETDRELAAGLRHKKGCLRSCITHRFAKLQI